MGSVASKIAKFALGIFGFGTEVFGLGTGIQQLLDKSSEEIKGKLDRNLDFMRDSFKRNEEFLKVGFKKNLEVMKEGFDKNFDAIKENLKAIDRNYDAIRDVSNKVDRNYDGIRHVGDKVDRNLNVMVSMFGQTKMILQSIQDSIKSEFDVLRKYVKKSKVELVTTKITFLIEEFFDKQILVYGLTYDELVTFLESQNGLSWLENKKEDLHESLHMIIENYLDFVLPENPDDELPFKTLQVLLMGLQAYFSVNMNLIDSYKFMANHYFSLNKISNFNKYIETLSSTIKNFEIVLVGRNGLIDKVKYILEEIQKIDFIRQERDDVVQFILNAENGIDKLKTEFQKLKDIIKFLENRPSIEVEYDFSKSNVTTPFGDWIDYQKVSYALQYRNDTDLSLISEWSNGYIILKKACPFLKLGKFDGKEERLIYRKIANNNPELVAIIKNKDQKEFRDIDKDLFNFIVLNENEGLAVQILELLLENEANVNAVYENDKPLIHFVIEKNKPKLLQNMLEHGAKINITDSDGREPIHLASDSNHIDLVRILIEKGANVNSKTKINWTPIHYACKVGDVEIAKLLIQKGANVTETIENDFNGLHIASSSGQDKMIDFLIETDKFDVNASSNKGLTPLHLAVIGEHVSAVKALLKNNMIDVNAVSEGKLRPLHYASMNGNLEIVQLLLRNSNINVNRLTSDKWSPLHLAILSKRENVALELLKREEINVNLKGKSNLTPLHLSSMNNLNQTISKLLEKKVNVEERDSYGSTALHTSCENGNVEIVKSLVKDGRASLNVKQANGNTPLMLASSKNNLEVVKFLKKCARVDDQNESGYKAVDFAAWKGNTEIFQYLSKERISITETDQSDEINCLDLAAFGNQLNFVKGIIEKNEKVLKQKDKEENTVLHYAALGGNLEMIEYLMEKNTFDLNSKNKDGNSMIHLAAINGNLRLVRYLNSKEVDINSTNSENYTPLLKAADLKQWSIVDFLTRKNVDTTKKNKNEDSILHFASRDNQKEVIEYLLEKREFDINDRNKIGWSAISYAARNGHLSLVKWMVEEQNADYKKVDNTGQTLLHLSTESGNLELVKYFLEKNLDVNSPNKTVSALYLASKNNNVEIAKYLLEEKGANMDALDQDQNTPILLAAKAKSWLVVKYLIEKNANLDLLDNEKNSILHEIAASDKIDLLELLKSKKIELKKREKNKKGRTPLHLAAMNAQYEMIKYLLENGLIFDEDNFRNTPTHYSAMMNDLDSVMYLTSKFDSDSKNYEGKTPCTIAESLEISKYLIETKNANYNNDLLDNVQNNNLGVLKYLIEVENLDPNSKDENGKNLLMAAAEFGKMKIVEYLVGRLRMDVNEKDKNEKYPIDYAIENNRSDVKLYLTEMDNDTERKPQFYDDVFEALDRKDLKATKYFIENRGVSSDARNSEGKSLLHIASSQSSLEIVQYLLDKNANSTATDNQGNTILHAASESENTIKILKYLIEEKKMDLELRNNAQETPLYTSSMFGNLEGVKYLLNKNANSNAKDEYGNTILHASSRGGNALEVVKYLLDVTKIGLESKNKFSDMPLHVSAEFGNLEGLKYYIKEKGMSPYAKGFQDGSTLHQTCRNPENVSSLNVVKYLVYEQKVDLYARDNYNETPLHDCATFQNLEAVEFFIHEMKMDPNVRGHEGRTALINAASSGHFEIVKFLSDNNADINARDDGHWTALKYARYFGYNDIASYLRSRGGIEDFNPMKIDKKSKSMKSLAGTEIRNSSEKISYASANTKKIEANQQAMANVQVQSVDLNSTLMLFNVLVRKFTNEKFISEYRKPPLMEAKMSALNIIEKFERILEKTASEFNVSLPD